ncbi:HDOD domain-containing protein [bacterium]|nr:HDOD domain-containing protein [bacterium]
MSEPLITRNALLNKLATSERYPSVPSVAIPFINMANDETTSFGKLSDVIETDPVLAARILTVANSGLYGFRREIKSITHALVMLGWNAIKMIALGSLILARMSDDDRILFDHSTRVAQIARFIAIEANLYKIEEFAVVGMLHDFGISILKTLYPNEHAEAAKLSIENAVPLHLAEREVLGVDHAMVGGWTLQAWNLPETITESVARHHTYDPDDYHARKTAVIHVADVFACATDYLGPTYEMVPEVSPEALEVMGFTNAELKDLLIAVMKMEFEPIVM